MTMYTEASQNLVVKVIVLLSKRIIDEVNGSNQRRLFLVH
jgi:hypothetical protein